MIYTGNINFIKDLTMIVHGHCKTMSRNHGHR